MSPVREIIGAVQLRDINLYKQVDYNQSLVPGVVIMAIFLGTLTTGAFNLVMDRFLGVEESYLLTPLTKFDIVAGLVISGLSITMMIAVVILGLSMLITGISFAGNTGTLCIAFHHPAIDDHQPIEPDVRASWQTEASPSGRHHQRLYERHPLFSQRSGVSHREFSVVAEDICKSEPGGILRCMH